MRLFYTYRFLKSYEQAPAAISKTACERFLRAVAVLRIPIAL